METTAVATYGTGAEKVRDRDDSRVMGKDEFLKLLIIQLQHQDPLNPLEDKEFIAQMAEFSSLEQMINLNMNLIEFMELQKLSEASNLIGREVEFFIEEGKVLKGIVDRVQFNRDGIALVATVDGEEYEFTLGQLVGIVS